MCGIAFWSKARRDSEITDARALAAALLGEIESRGRDAAGAAWLDSQRVAWWQKNCVKGSVLAKHLSVPGNSVQGILHARFATKGSPDLNVNNHPIVRDGIVLVHNGHISNDDRLFARLKVDRVGQVDSEVIAASIMHGKGTLAARLTAPQGNAAVAWMEVTDQDAGNSQIIHVARLSTSPLFIGQTAAGDLLGASTQPLLMNACRRTGITLTWAYDVPEWTYMKVRRGVIEIETKIGRPEWDKRAAYKWPITGTGNHNTTYGKPIVLPADYPSRQQIKAYERGEMLFGDRLSDDQFLDEWALDEEDYAAMLKWRSDNEWRGNGRSNLDSLLEDDA